MVEGEHGVWASLIRCLGLFNKAHYDPCKVDPKYPLWPVGIFFATQHTHWNIFRRMAALCTTVALIESLIWLPTLGKGWNHAVTSNHCAGCVQPMVVQFRNLRKNMTLQLNLSHRKRCVLPGPGLGRGPKFISMGGVRLRFRYSDKDEAWYVSFNFRLFFSFCNQLKWGWVNTWSAGPPCSLKFQVGQPRVSWFWPSICY